MNPKEPIKLFRYLLITIFLLAFGFFMKLEVYPFSKAEKNQQRKITYRNIKLEHLLSFPVEKDINSGNGLWDARYFCSDGKGRYYISDSRFHCLLVYDRNGRYLFRISRKGNAPGELLSPRQVVCLKNFIIVNDSGNHRVSFFSYNGEFLKSFPLYKSYYEMDAVEEGKIFAVPLFLKIDQPLIDVLSFDGKILYSFGKGKKFTNLLPLNSIKIAAGANKIFVAFESLGILQTYSENGSLIKEQELNEYFIREQRSINLKRDKSLSRSNLGFVTIIQKIRTFGKDLFLLCNFPMIQIIQISESGDIINKYWTKRESQTMVTDFIVSQSKEDEISEISILQMNPENQIKIYKTIRVDSN
jgi:hypothetical protein